MKADAMVDLGARILRAKGKSKMPDAIIAANLKAEKWDPDAVDRLMRDPGLTRPT